MFALCVRHRSYLMQCISSDGSIPDRIRKRHYTIEAIPSHLKRMEIPSAFRDKAFGLITCQFRYLNKELVKRSFVVICVINFGV